MANLKEQELALKAVSSSFNKFAFNFYENVSKTPGNFICSPLSVSVVLSMANFGAEGSTKKEFSTALYLDEEDEDVYKNGFQYFIDLINNVKKVELRLANKIFTAIDLQVRPEYKLITETYFRSESESIDFRNVDEACSIINKWSSDMTNSRIKEIVKPGVVNGSTRVVLINAVYFKGNWKEKFEEDFTQPEDFYIDDITVKQVPTMYQSSKFNHGVLSNLNASYLELPYECEDENDSISMFIILPDEKFTLNQIESKLSEIDFKQLHQNRPSGFNIDVKLPKFKIESEFDLNDVLMDMGMREMFTGNANFKRMVESEGLMVDKVIQKAFLEVNEEGSEAAAVTAMMMMRCAFVPSTPFVVNKPFFCSIVATKTGTQLFSARITDPTV